MASLKYWLLADCERLGLRILTLGDADYPDRLKNIYDPPAVLYVKGRLPAFDEEIAVAVVGSRRPSEYGKRMAGRLGLELAREGALVVSGIAQGLDTEAVRGALKGGGPVVSVLGTAGGLALSCAQPHHQRRKSGCGGGGVRRAERYHDHRPAGVGPGPGCVCRARKCGCPHE